MLNPSFFIRKVSIFLILGPFTLWAQQKPNVLFIICDDLRAELGCYGANGIHSPNIDQIARDGMVFLNSFAQQAICSPSRTSFLTGLRPDSTFVFNNRDHFRGKRPHLTTLPQHFKNHGYQTQGLGKVFHGILNDPLSWSLPGQDHDHPEYGPFQQAKYDSIKSNWQASGKWQVKTLIRNEHGYPVRETRQGQEHSHLSWEAVERSDYELPDGQICKDAESAIVNFSKNPKQAFFLAVGFHRPHLPYVAPKKYFEYYPPTSIGIPESKEKPLAAPDFAFHPYDELREFQDIPDQGATPFAQQLALIRAYYASLSYTDALIGNLCRQLKDLGLYDNTIIVVLGDHGYHLGEQNVWTKQTNFDWGTRAPLIIKPVGIKPKKHKTTELVELIDLFPSLSEMAGLAPLSKQWMGQSFNHLFAKPDKAYKPYAISQYPRKNYTVMGYSYRGKKERFTQWIDLKSKRVLQEEYYRYHKTDKERSNLISAPEMASQVEKWRKIAQMGRGHLD
jgi:arylsulfatase A-like enzyme